ncbi:hypothetical protein [Bradyrhizobium elkanii]|uniref:hypothetical protein n=1 Tax=Bradyrhizobium elkanii TaxID=29448 RepID=UPI0004AFEB2A|nr:hypothetical protein [Bradyrhizobium elkanii]
MLKLPHDLLERTLDKIQANREIPPEKLVGTIDRLEILYSIAIVHQQYSSRQMRSDLDLATKDILREIRKLQATLRNTAWMAEPLRLAAIHAWTENKRPQSSAQTRRTELVVPSDSLQQIEQPLNDLTETLVHLQDTVRDYDLLGDDSALLKWIGQGNTETGQLVRAELSTYFKKGGGIKPDTLIIRHIAELYEYAFDQKFSVTSSAGKAAYENRLGKLELEKLNNEADSRESSSRPSQYEGNALRFACAVINCLRLQNIIVPLETRSPADDPPVTNDKENYNRAFALQGRSVPYQHLADRIGHIWKNEAKRKRRASSSSDFDISSDTSDD